MSSTDTNNRPARSLRRACAWLGVTALLLLGCASAPGGQPASPAGAPACPSARVAVQVLGSGGPIAEGSRASSSYLVWMDGKARVLVDAGGGAKLRFGEAKAHIEDLDVIAISHLHVDHVADLIALLKAGYFADRSRPLPIVGPSAGADFPSMEEFLRGQLDAETAPKASSPRLRSSSTPRARPPPRSTAARGSSWRRSACTTVGSRRSALS
jgi:hypothetical protein